mgnify:CR=1 FL=1
MNLIRTSNYEENKEVIEKRLEESDKKTTIIYSIVMTVIILFFVACAAYAIYGETQSIKEALTLCGVLIVALVLLIVDAIIDSFNYKTEYKINDLKFIEAAMTGNIASIATQKDAGARSTLVYYIVETKTGEKIMTRNGLIKPTIHSGDATETTFDLDKLELNVYM